MKNVHQLEIEIKGKEWADILDKTFKKKSKEVKIDGFRKGTIPKNIYLKKFGIESLYMDAVDEALKLAYQKEVSKSDLVPVIEPKVDIKHICEDCVTFLITITTKPEIKLGAYKNLKVKKEKVAVLKEEIDKGIADLLNKYAEIVVKEDGTVVEGNTAVIDFEGFVDKKPLEGGNGNDYPLEIGSHTFIPGFEEGIVGMKVGDKKELKLKFPEDYTPELKGKEVLFKVTIKSIKERVLPELNEDFYKDLAMDNVKDESSLRKEIEKSIKSKKESEIENVYIEDCLAKATENMTVSLTDEIIDEEIHRMTHQYEDQLKMQGLSLEQYFEFTKTTMNDLKEKMKDEAIKRIKYRYLLEEVCSTEEIKVTDSEAKKEAEKMAKNYAMETEEFLKEFGGLDMMKYDAQMRKAIEIIKENK